jgi:hypothetical protein
MLSCKQQHEKTNHRIKAKPDPTTLHLTGVFNLIFLGKSSKTILIAGKIEGKKLVR